MPVNIAHRVNEYRAVKLGRVEQCCYCSKS